MRKMLKKKKKKLKSEIMTYFPVRSVSETAK